MTYAADHPAVKPLEAQLEAAVQRGEFRYAITFLDDRARYADVPSEHAWYLEVVICTAICDECLARPGEAPSALRQRVAAAIDAGALEFAVARLGRSAHAADTGCMLLDVLTRYGAVDASALWRLALPEVNAVSALVRYLSCVGDLSTSVSWTDTPPAGPLTKVMGVQAAYDALLSFAGTPVGPPHKLALQAANIPQGHCSAVLREAIAGRLHLVILSQVIRVVDVLKRHEQQNAFLEAVEQLWTFLRSAGRAFRWMWMSGLWHPRIEGLPHVGEAFKVVTDAMLEHRGNDALQNWGITYAFLPVVHGLRRRTRPADPADPINREALTFCRGRCCVDIHKELHQHRFMLLARVAIIWQIAFCALREHVNCVRPVARMMAWGAFECPEIQRVLNGFGTLDLLRQLERAFMTQRARRSVTSPSLAADADEEEEVGSDGERLSEWGDDDGPPPNLGGEASTQALVARALRAISGDTVAAAAAAADAAAAALLAELESEKDSAAAVARKKSKSKKKKGKAYATLTGRAADTGRADDTAAVAHDGGDGGDADDAQEDPAQLLSAQPAAAPPSAEAVTAESLFPWLSLADASDDGSSQAGAPPAMPEDAPHEDDEMCVICLDAPRDTPLAGCGHAHPAVLCADCARRLLAAAGAPACPLCRAPAAPL
jgi:hypothetical protein